MAGSNFEMPSKAYEAISAMQKCIRRADERGAGYWFTWLANEGLHHVALGRLNVCLHEDIGIGDPSVVVFAQLSLQKASDWLKTKNEAWRLAAANAIMAMCRAKKSRESDHFVAAMRNAVELNPNVDVPDYAFDKHTRKGRALGRGMEHFRTVGAVLVPQPCKDEYEDEAYEYWNRHFRGPKPPVDVPQETQSLFNEE